MKWMIRLVATGLLLATGGTVLAQVPQTLSYQGYLTDSSGQALQNSVAVEFSIYTVESGGLPLWSEFQSVFPSQGLFSTSFGNVSNPFPAGMFDTPLYLGIRVSTDDEMTPRVPMTAAAYSHKSKDSETVGGFSAAQLDQTADIASLSNTLSNTNNNVNALSSDVAGNTTSIASVQVDADANALDISTLQTSTTATEGDVTALENTIPTLQPLVSNFCSSGSSIRRIFSNGSVSCEIDDTSPWGLINDNLYYITGSIGVGTSAPVAAVQIDAPLGVDPFRARVQSATKLRVHQNGSVSVGTSSAGPDNGLFVSGAARIGSGSSTARMTVSDPLWQTALNNSDSGGDDWFLGSSATGWAIGGGKFVVSPTDSSNNSALVIDSNKDVGIGTTDPLTRLHLAGGSDVSASGGGYLTIGGITGANIAVDSNEIMARSNGSAATLNLNVEGGEVRINSGGSRDHDSLEVRGRVYFDNGGNSGMRITGTNSSPTNALFEPTAFEEGLVGGSTSPFWRMYSREFYAQSSLQYRTYSDRSLKSNIVRIDSALDKIKALEGVSYSLSTSPMGKRERALTEQEQFVNDNQVGFIAQDVAKVLPQLVTEDEFSGLKTVAYMGVIPVLVEALKEQQKQLEAQRKELDELKARLK